MNNKIKDNKKDNKKKNQSNDSKTSDKELIEIYTLHNEAP